MNTKKSAASKAAKAAACLKGPTSVTLPSMKQAMLTAVALVQKSLNGLELIRIHDEEWNEHDVDVDYAVGLVQECLDNLRQELPDERSIFDHQWFTAASIINLCVSGFDRRDCHYYRALTSLQNEFDVMFATVEFIEAEVEHA